MASSNGQYQLRCEDYHVAWICPVADIELLPARLMLDEEHPAPSYDTYHDENTYICGRINGHAVVVATLPQGETGNVNAGRLTGSMFKTFPDIRMAVLVGIGGGIPRTPTSRSPLDDVHLGDVVVGWVGDGKPACVYHDRGRAKVGGEFEMVGTMQNPDWRLLSALSMLTSDHKLRRTKFHDQLARLRDFDEFAHPGLEQDLLFQAGHRHAGGWGSDCTVCNPDELVLRPLRTEDDKDKFIFHQGRIATGNAVIKDGELRDRIGARCGGALCIEMEAAGIDANRRCLVIRGISDYADSHKRNVWQPYAAGKAAAFARELLCRIQPATVKGMEGVNEAPWLVPFIRPHSFVGRDAQLAQLRAHVLSEGGRRLAVYGLGGCGKTALALEMAYRTREQQPKRAVFWVPAVSRESFEQAYRDIGGCLRIPGIAENNANVKQLVKAQLSDEGRGQWLVVVDNADDDSVLFGGADRLIDWLPLSRKGSIVFTTRTRTAAIKLAESNVVVLGELAEAEAREMLRKRLLPARQQQLQDEKTVTKFVDMLAFLALAIVQAVAFVNTNDVTLSDYISDYQSSEGDAIALLGQEFEDQGRYRDSKNPVATTWYISFKQIQKENKLAADHLSFMACIANTNIPASLLPLGGSRVEQTKAVGTLKAYAFVTESATETGKSEKVFDVHPLVHLAMREWLKKYGEWVVWAEKTLERLVEMVPLGDLVTREVWTIYLPHATHIVGVPEVYDLENRMSLLGRIGKCEYTLGRYRAAESAHRQAFERMVEVLGGVHPDTLTSMNEVAAAMLAQGKYTEVEAIHRATLAGREKVLGKEHLGTLKSMGEVAWALAGQGKYAEAETMHRATLAVREKVQGTEHPHTLTSMNHLADTLIKQGEVRRGGEDASSSAGTNGGVREGAPTHAVERT
ncbi:uncharacterized protein N0V89_004949 [Didymosphaeria variabile]|uniref:Kinesin light chain n=1 Tax=Didymosphaeria variabile TaxID=1932322 RepID=A0A9W8XMK4_9PLEO|nr:uncharacterized protein N0V89_004949 [Didymosphaeria variabile]KAJ4353222.1 hypothetical protein N0V89_004949 [Didymosphaeria variabile]